MRDIFIFTTNNSTNFMAEIALKDLPKHNSLALEKLFIGFNDFDWGKVLRFDFLDTINHEAIKLVLNVNYIPSNTDIYLDSDVIQKINETANCYLWILSPWESKIHEQKLLDSINNNPISNDKVIVTTSNSEYDEREIDGVKFISYPNFWEMQYAHHVKHFNEVSFIPPAEKKDKIFEAEKKFLCLNRNLKDHRVWTYYTLINSLARYDGHISYHLPSVAKEEGINFKNYASEILKDKVSNVDWKKAKACYKDKKLDTLHPKWIINHGESVNQYYNNSLFSIVSESMLREQFLTEKTFKPMMHGHPFVFIGSSKNIDILHDRGYQTFEDIFGVRAIENPKQLQNFLDKVATIPLEEWRNRILDVWSRVEHNYHVLLGAKNRFSDFQLKVEKITEKDRTNGYFCMAPWVHMSIWQQGQAYPCCVYDWRTPIGNINDQGIVGTWNSDAMKTLRLELLDGKAPKGCERCTELDKQGIYSYRRKITEDYKHHIPLVDTTNPDGSVDKVNLAYFDIRFSNLCNMKCRSCGPHFSSKWAEDTKGKPHIIEIDNYEMWQEIELYIDTIEEIYFTGGESLFMDQHYKLLDMIIAHNRHPKLVYNSNGSKLEHKGKKVVEYWKKIDNVVEFQVSLDQIGSKAEYTRHGQKWQTIENNLKFITNNCKNVSIIPNPTISVLNILDLKEILLYLFENNLLTRYRTNLNNLLMTPEWMSIQILPNHLKYQAEENLRSFLKEIDNYNMESWVRSDYLNTIPKIINMMYEKDETYRIPEFKKEMQKLDTIRGENFLDVFPELQELYE